MSETFKWGVIGPGNIAKSFASGVALIEDSEIYAAASRTPGKAEAFIKEVGGQKAYTSYEDLVNDPMVDAVYVSTPHVFHRDHSILALKAGKPVLCEKPMTICEAHTKAILDTAREQGVFCMEAMWTRFFPLMVKVRELIKEGVLGDVRMVNADFGFRSPVNPKGRLYNPELGGGGLLDVGVYPISFFNMILGEPVTVQGAAHIGETGVDEQAAFVFGHADGSLAYGSCAVRTQTTQAAEILGTEGRILIDTNFWKPHRFTLHVNGKEPEVFEFPEDGGTGFKYEAMAVRDAVRAGKKESEIMPHEDSRAIARTMDKLRAQWNLRYPMED